MRILKVTKHQGLSLSLKDTFLEKPHENGGQIDFLTFLGLRSSNVCQVAGIDELSSHFLKDGSPVLSKPISELCNLSIKLGRFFNYCKILKLKTLFQKGSKINPSNYRLISLLYLIIEKKYPWTNK